MMLLVQKLLGKEQNGGLVSKQETKIVLMSVQDVFFDGKHLEKEEFDDNWKEEVEKQVQEIAEERVT